MSRKKSKNLFMKNKKNNDIYCIIYTKLISGENMQVIAEILGMTENALNKKKDTIPVVQLLQKYFTEEELKEFLENKEVKKQELVKDITKKELKENLKELINQKIEEKIESLKNQKID